MTGKYTPIPTPSIPDWRYDDEVHQEISLRDRFAGQFLAGAAVGNDPLNRAEGESIDAARARYWAGVAEVAYIVADAMLAARGAK